MTSQTAGLGSSAARGAGVTLVGQLARVLVQFGGLFVLARLLNPTDYGLLAAITAVVGIGEVVRDFGLSSAAIQAKELSKGQSNNLFWINSALGLVMAIGAFALSGVIAVVFHNPILQPLTQVLSVTFIFNGVSTQFRAQLNRDLKFGSLAGADIVGQLLGLGAGIVFALMGWGVWALIAQQIIAAVTTLVGLALMSSWKPGPISRQSSVRPFFAYGFHLMGAQLLNYASQNVDSVLIGGRMGMTQLGLYNRAFQLLTLPLSQVNAPATRVALPVLSKLRDDVDRYRDFLLTGQSALINLVLAIFAFGCAQSYPLVDLALGSHWHGVSPIFQILAVAGAFQVCAYATYWVFLSKGLTKANLRFALVYRPIAILAIIGGSFLGSIYTVSWAYTLSVMFGWILGLVWIGRISDAPALAMFLNGVRGLVGYALAGAASFFAVQWMPLSASFARIGLGAVAFIAALAVLMLVWPRFRRDALSVRRIVLLVRRPK